VISRLTVICLGLSQLTCWGLSYYLVGALGPAIIADLGWRGETVHGGFSAALLVMGLASPLVGRLIDRHGGRASMTAGSLLLAAGCGWLGLAETVSSYYGAWLLLGVAMRLTLYDAAFAALAHIGGTEAKRPIAHVTLLGGLASTVFWPFGVALAEAFGWRGAVFVYAGCALLTIPLHLAIPGGRGKAAHVLEAPEHRPLAAGGRDRLIAGGLYALIATVANLLNAGLSAHMVGMLTGLGLSAALAVWVASLRGIGQSLARLCEVLFGRNLAPLNLNLLAALILPLCFLTGLFSAQFLMAAVAFAFFYGAGNGLLTITRGTLPLTLFDHRTYGSFVGKLLVPSFLFSAAGPVIYAFVIERYSEAGALYLSFGLAVVILIAAGILKWRFASPNI
jgi:hypothetical protein